MSEIEWEELDTLVAAADFWSLATEGGASAKDGARWILEISELHRYHIVDRQSGGELEAIGRWLLERSGLNPDPIY